MPSKKKTLTKAEKAKKQAAAARKRKATMKKNAADKAKKKAAASRKRKATLSKAKGKVKRVASKVKKTAKKTASKAKRSYSKAKKAVSNYKKKRRKKGVSMKKGSKAVIDTLIQGVTGAGAALAISYGANKIPVKNDKIKAAIPIAIGTGLKLTKIGQTKIGSTVAVVSIAVGTLSLIRQFTDMDLLAGENYELMGYQMTDEDLEMLGGAPIEDMSGVSIEDMSGVPIEDMSGEEFDPFADLDEYEETY